MHFLDSDDDGHWYIIPEAKREDWESFLMIPTDNPASWDVPEYARAIGGHPNRIIFYGYFEKE